MKTYGFGIIGCGMISDYHSAAIAELEGGQLVGCQFKGRRKRKAGGGSLQCELVSRLQ